MTYISKLPRGSRKPDTLAVIIDLLRAARQAEAYAEVRIALVASYGEAAVRDAELKID